MHALSAGAGPQSGPAGGLIFWATAVSRFCAAMPAEGKAATAI